MGRCPYLWCRHSKCSLSGWDLVSGVTCIVPYICLTFCLVYLALRPCSSHCDVIPRWRRNLMSPDLVSSGRLMSVIPLSGIMVRCRPLCLWWDLLMFMFLLVAVTILYVRTWNKCVKMAASSLSSSTYTAMHHTSIHLAWLGPTTIATAHLASAFLIHVRHTFH